MAKITILIVLIINLLLPSSSFGQSGSNKVYSFLELPVSPRIAALSRHIVSHAQPDLFSSISNPAYLDSTFHQSVQVGYYSHFSDASMSNVSYAHYFNEIGLLTTTLRYLSYGDFQRLDENGFETGSFSAYDMAFTTSLSRTIYPNLQLGIASTLVRSSIQTFSSHALLGSVGLYYSIPDELITIGFTTRDIGFQLDSYNSTQEPIPFDVSLGLSKKFKYVPFRFTATIHSLQQWPLKTIYESENPSFTSDFLRHLAFGGEFLFSESFVLRFGFNKFQADAISTSERLDFSGTAFGAGFKVSRFLIDVSRSSFSSIGSHYQLSISTQF